MLDNSFNQIKNLNWYPWIGNNYAQERLLLIGESFYEDNHGWLSDKNAVRKLVNNQGLHSHLPQYANRKFFTRIEQTFYNKPDISFQERTTFWQSVAFVNLVQRILPDIKHRPEAMDYDTGWLAMLSVINTIKPAYCVRLGVEGTGRLGYVLANNAGDWTYNRRDFDTRPYVIHLKNSYHATRIIVTNHPSGSRGYNYGEWASVISRNKAK